MAYVPPHQRHSVDGVRRAPVPESLVLPFQQKLNVHRKSAPSGGKSKESWAETIVYADESVTRWWIVGSMEDDLIPESLRLEPTSVALFEHETGEKPFVLVKSDSPTGPLILTADHEDAEAIDKSPWIAIADKVHPHLISSLKSFKSERVPQDTVFSPSLVIRVGKILFYGNSSFPATLENLKLDGRQKTRRMFHTNLPEELVEEIVHTVVPKLGSYLLREKEQYHVKVNDQSQPGVTYTCKCYVTKESSELKVHKIYSNQVRHMMLDMSSVDKDLDLRIMLNRKQRHINIQDEIKEALFNLVAAGTIESRTKGGLKWALGKGSFDNRFTVVGSWHAKQRKFKFDLDTSLYVKWVDRFDYVSCKGGISNEITLKMDRARQWMKDDCLDEDTISKTLKEAVKITWENLLNCRYPFH